MKPNDEMMRLLWFVREFGMLSRQENSAKTHVFGSVRHSIILNPYKSRVFQVHIINYLLLLLEMLVLDTGLVALDAVDSNCALFGSQKPSICGRVWEKEPEINKLVGKTLDVLVAHQ